MSEKTHHPKFGDRIRGIYMGEDHPMQNGMFVKTVRRTGKTNRGLFYEVTDGKGEFWLAPPESTEIVSPPTHSGAEGLRIKDIVETAFIIRSEGVSSTCEMDELVERLADKIVSLPNSAEPAPPQEKGEEFDPIWEMQKEDAYAKFQEWFGSPPQHG